MAAYGAPASLVHPDALDEVFDIIDANGDGVLTVNEFIMVRESQIRRNAPRSPRDLSRGASFRHASRRDACVDAQPRRARSRDARALARFG